MECPILAPHCFLRPSPRLRAYMIMVLAITLCALTSTAPIVAFEEIPLATSPVSQSTDAQGRSSVALAGGGFAVVWLVQDFAESALQMQWLDADGEILFENGGRTLAEGAGLATLAADPAGGAFVAYGGSFANPIGIHVQSFDADGNARWPGNGVEASTLDDLQTSPTLVPDDSGGVYVCFSLSTAQQIRCQHFNAAGARSWDEQGLSTGGFSGIQARPLAVADDAGGVMVFWRNQRDPSDNEPQTMLMEGQRFNSAGNSLWGNGLMLRDTYLPEDFAYQTDFFAVHGDGSGGAILVFEAKADQNSSNQGIVAHRVSGDGTYLWGDGTVVVDDVASTQLRNAIQTHDGGTVVVSSQDIGEVTTRLRLFRLDGAGEHLWPEAGIQLSDPDSTGHNLYPHGSFDDGILRMAWTQQMPESPFEMDIFMARFRQDGTRLSPEKEIVTSAPIAQSCSAVVFSQNEPEFFVLWDDLRSNNFENSDVYGALARAAVISADGFELGDTSAWTVVSPQ